MSADNVSTPQSGKDISDEDLVRKYSTENVSRYKQAAYEFTRDPALLHQYAGLCERYQLIEHEQILSQADEAQVVVARADLLCLGGAKLTLSKPLAPVAMPMEAYGFRLADLFPVLDLHESCYGEISDFVMMPDYERSAIAAGIVQGIVKMAAIKGVDYLFYLSPMPQARNMQQAMHKIGVNTDIRREMVIPEQDVFGGMKMVLSVMDMAKYRSIMQQIKRESLILLEPEA